MGMGRPALRGAQARRRSPGLAQAAAGKNPKIADFIAERLVASLGRSVPIDGRVVRAPASIGIALSRHETDGPDQLLREAEAAMTAAKRRGGNRYQLHGAPA